jgi:signal transduction histidine kinase
MTGPDAERLRIVVHELRSPVAALEALSAAAAGMSDAPSVRRLVGLAVAAARDVERLVSDPELVSLRPELVDLASFLDRFASPAVTVNADGVYLVRADPTRLRQAVANLVANALRHGTTVVVDVAERRGSIEIVVTDDGPGIEPALDPFARGVSSAGSTGYGLWLARMIAEAHGGTLELVAEPGAGARLRLSLPPASGAS